MAGVAEGSAGEGPGCGLSGGRRCLRASSSEDTASPSPFSLAGGLESLQTSPLTAEPQRPRAARRAQRLPSVQPLSLGQAPHAAPRGWRTRPSPALRSEIPADPQLPSRPPCNGDRDQGGQVGMSVQKCLWE